MKVTHINNLTPKTAPSEQEADGYRSLMGAILVQAVRDTKNGALPKRLDACLWLGGPDAGVYTEALGIAGDPVDLLTSGRIKKNYGRKASKDTRKEREI